MRNFYDVLKSKIKAGQYTMEEIVGELQLAYEKNYIDLVQLEELKKLAETCVDPSYNGNKYATSYDMDQDVLITSTELSVLELFDLVMGTGAPITAHVERFAARSAIGDIYTRHVILGLRKFSEVHPSKQEEVAGKLIAQKRCDLIDIPSFHPPHIDCPHGNIPLIPLEPVKPAQ